MSAAQRSDITLSPGPLEDAEDGFVQVEFPAFGLPEHRAELPVRLAHRGILPVHGVVDQHHAHGRRLVAKHGAGLGPERMADAEITGQVVRHFDAIACQHRPLHPRRPAHQAVHEPVRRRRHDLCPGVGYPRIVSTGVDPSCCKAIGEIPLAHPGHASRMLGPRVNPGVAPGLSYLVTPNGR